MASVIIQTDRLILRQWCEEDLEAFAKLNADPRVMEYFPSVKSFEETLEEYHRILQHFTQYGWGFWAVSLIKQVKFMGFIGLRFDDFQAPFTPAVEIGWRLAFEYWNQGYATEGAKAALKYGFQELKLAEIISFASTFNMRSRAVMERIGMHHDPKDDFNHPTLSTKHKLSRNVLYRIGIDEWKNTKYSS